MINLATLMTNPSFDDVITTGQYLAVTTSNIAAAIPGWTMTGTVDVNGTWDGDAANNTVDLYGTNAMGSLSQTVTTVVGQKYFFDFKAIAGNAGAGAATQARVEVQINGTGLVATGQTTSVFYPGTAASANTIASGMKTFRYEFTATSTSTTVTIAGSGSPTRSDYAIMTDGFIAPPLVVACFVRGSYLEVPGAEKKIEELSVGDLVKTDNNGMQVIRWIGSRKVVGKGGLAPILFKKNSFNNHRDLMVSPEHRMYCDSHFNDVLFGFSERLIAAKQLVNNNDIIQVEMDEVEYFHILFDDHQILSSSGAISESFHPGKESYRGLTIEARKELFKVLPDLEQNEDAYGPTVYPVMQRHEAELFRFYYKTI